MKKNIYAALMVGAVVIILAVLLSSTNHSPQKDQIRFGFIGPLSGEFAVYGDIEKNVVQIAVDEINAAGGINGHTIEVEYEDDQCAPAKALSAAHKLMDIQRIKILLVTCSQTVLPLAAVTEKEHALVFASYAVASGITHAGDYVFRNAYSNQDIASTAAQVISKEHALIAMITESSDYSVSFHDDFISAYAKSGGGMISDERYAGQGGDIRTVVAKTLASNPDAVLVNPSSDATGIAILNELKKQGYRGALFGNFFGSSNKVQSLSAAQGMIYFADPVVADSPKKEALLEKYKARYGSYPDYEYPAAARYDSVYILKQAIENVGDDPTAVKDYLYSMPYFSGALGTYHFDANGDITDVKPVVNRIIDGHATRYSD